MRRASSWKLPSFSIHSLSVMSSSKVTDQSKSKNAFEIASCSPGSIPSNAGSGEPRKCPTFIQTCLNRRPRNSLIHDDSVEEANQFSSQPVEAVLHGHPAAQGVHHLRHCQPSRRIDPSVCGVRTGRSLKRAEIPRPDSTILCRAASRSLWMACWPDPSRRRAETPSIECRDRCVGALQSSPRVHSTASAYAVATRFAGVLRCALSHSRKGSRRSSDIRVTTAARPCE